MLKSKGHDERVSHIRMVRTLYVGFDDGRTIRELDHVVSQIGDVWKSTWPQARCFDHAVDYKAFRPKKCVVQAL